MKTIYFILSFLLCTQVLALDLKKVEWKLFKEKNGIRVYKPLNGSKIAGIIPIRFNAILNHNISKVLTVLSDNVRKKEWMPSLKRVSELERVSSKERIVYYLYGAPWPFSDRDFIVRSYGEFDKSSSTVNVEIKSVEHENDPKTKNAVRGISADGYSIIRGIGENKTEVEMAFLNDFKGSIPTFVINFVQARWPFQFMKNIREQLSKKDIVIDPEFRQEK